MKITQNAIRALCSELDQRANMVNRWSHEADTLKEQWTFAGHAEAYRLIKEELEERGCLVPWQE